MIQLIRNGDVFEASLDETMLLLNSETGRYHGLNPVAARIWDILAEPVDEATIITRLVEEFAVSPEECGRHVTSFVAALRERGLIVES
jgi:hypothetical protein